MWTEKKAKGSKVYEYWRASWREGDRVRNVHLGSCKKKSRDEALTEAKRRKAEALGLVR